MHKNVDKNDFFRKVTVEICSSLDIEIAMPRCLKYLKTCMPADSICMTIYEPALRSIRTIAYATAEKGDIVEQLIPLSRDARKTVENSASKKVEFTNSVGNHPVAKCFLPFLKYPGNSCLVLHIKIEGEKLGVLTIFAKGSDRYCDDDARLLSVVLEPFAIAMSNALRHQELMKLKDRLADDNKYLQQELRHISGKDIIGSDFGLKDVIEMVRRVAPVNNPVLLLGETGTGKEVIANAIHYSSPRKDGPLIKVNCGAIPETLLDSELFGHEKGAFTGAINQKRGRFERADKGTIFLDEIGELPLNAQVRLLRVIQTKEIERVGGTKPVFVDIRIIAATHRNLESMVKSGQFREDLWFRLNIFPIIIPPLRQRKNDIPALVYYFFEKKLRETGMVTPPVIVKGTIDHLLDYHWPGNVRELENIVERAVVLSTDGFIRFDNFTSSQAEISVSESDKTGKENFQNLDNAVAHHIQTALALCEGKVHGPNGAAELLSVNPSTLRNRMRKLGIAHGRKA